MAPHGSSAVIQVFTDPRLIWKDVIYNMFKSQIIVITVAAKLKTLACDWAPELDVVSRV